MDSEICEIEATCTSGLEEIAKEEAWTRLKIRATTEQGRILMNLPVSQARQVLQLRCVDNIYVVILRKEHVDFSSTLYDALQQVDNLVPEADWSLGLNVWAQFIGFKLPVLPLPQDLWLTMKKDTNYMDNKLTETGSNEANLVIDNEGSNEGAKRDVIDEGIDSLTLNENPEESSHRATECNIELGGSYDRTVVSAAANDRHTDRKWEETSSASNKAPNITTFKDQRAELFNCLHQTATHGGYEHCGESAETCLSHSDSSQESDLHMLNNSNHGNQRITSFNPDMPSFRVTCNRAGSNHCFQSPQVARCFGGEVNDYFGWNVDLTNADINTVLNIRNNRIYIAIALTKCSRHRRNITHFGRLTLRATLCAAMLRLCHIRAGDVVCDPMSGTGGIPLEGMLGHPYSFNVAGEIDELSVEKAHKNIEHVCQANGNNKVKLMSADVIQWDVQHLPFRDSSCDVIISDLPFGKRSGSHTQNWTLYPAALQELARVTRLNTGRACLLTQDKKCMQKTLVGLQNVWKHSKTTYIQHGGLRNTAIYLLKRTAECLPK